MHVPTKNTGALMTYSPMTRPNIPITNFLKSWMSKTGMGEYWPQDPGLVSNGFTNIDKGKRRIKDNN